jgi:hypothetical protein
MRLSLKNTIERSAAFVFAPAGTVSNLWQVGCDRAATLLFIQRRIVTYLEDYRGSAHL